MYTRTQTTSAMASINGPGYPNHTELTKEIEQAWIEAEKTCSAPWVLGQTLIITFNQTTY
jgi:hypothetical protein